MNDERRPIRRGRDEMRGGHDDIRGVRDDHARLRSILAGALGSVFLGVLLVGCGGGTAVPNATASPSVGAAGPTAPSGSVVASPFPSDPFPSAPIPDSPVAGVVVTVQASAPPAASGGGTSSAVPGDSASITGFTLLTTSGVELKFVIGQVDDLSDFPLGSLADHAASQVPILVYFKVQGADLVVYHLEDAG
jgi:hypothetical protein